MALFLFEEPLPQDLWRHWEWPPLPLAVTIMTVAVYLRGWNSARRTRPLQLPPWRAICFVLGWLTFWLAIASPIAAFDDYLLSVHMLQHFLLMTVAPPLVILGAPSVPLLRGLPRPLIRGVVRPLITRRWCRAVLHFLLHPATVWIAMNATYLGWHIPAAFERTFTSEMIHDLEHAMFFATSCMFWLVVIAPWPLRRVWPQWAMIPYLLSADILNTILCALLAFSGRILYHSYAEAPRVSSLSALQDQVAAGGEMWILNSTIFLGFAAYLTVHLLTKDNSVRRDVNPASRSW